MSSCGDGRTCRVPLAAQVNHVGRIGHHKADDYQTEPWALEPLY